MNRRPKLTIAGLALASLAAAMVIIPTATAGAIPDGNSAPPSAQYPAEMLKALARDAGIQPAQAEAVLAAERQAGQVDKALREVLGAAYAGGWVTGKGQLNVAVTSNAAATLARQAGATPKLVTRGGSTMNALQSKLDARAARAPKGVASWYVAVTTNSLVVEAIAGARTAARAFVKASGVDAAAVRYQTATEMPRPLIDVIGGNAYFIGTSTRCSVGFSVVGGFVTAGHCGRTGNTTSQPTGSFAGSSFPGNDYAWVRVSAGNTPRPIVNGYGNGNVTVAGSQDAPVGARVCRSGSTTGFHCGTINARNTSVTYPQGTVTGLIRTNVCAEPGDSGGSLVAGNQAQGVTSGGSGNCTTGGTIFFQPVNEALQAFNLTLLTSGNPTPPSPTPTPTSTQPPGGTTWAPWTPYATGSTVTYNGQRYQCRQGHTSLPGWEPPIVPALWLAV